jgi:hypothetical protein
LGEREEIEKKRERRGRDWNNGGVCERGMKERKREEDSQRGKGRDWRRRRGEDREKSVRREGKGGCGGYWKTMEGTRIEVSWR